MTRIAAGQLTETVELLGGVRVEDGYGGSSTTEGVVARFRARITPVRGSERILADRANGVQTYRITVRASTASRAITTDSRLRWRGRRLDVSAVPEPGGDPTVVIEAEAGGEV